MKGNVLNGDINDIYKRYATLCDSHPRTNHTDGVTQVLNLPIRVNFFLN